MHHLRLIARFLRASAQQEMAYSVNFFINLLYSVLNLGVGVAGLGILYSQVQTLRGWTYPATLALLGIYLTVSALRGLFIGPSLESLAGMEGEIITGRFDFTLLKPVDIQFMATFRTWRLFALFDLLLGIGVIVRALTLPGASLDSTRLVVFFITLASGMTVMYSILLFFSALAFWSPGFLFTWVFDGIFQMARYPVGLYPGWVRIVLTWVVPVGIITTIPAQALSGGVPPATLAGSLILAAALFLGASFLFRRSLRRYTSASS
jgi:ABC-2 type transport system permease protein